jgi:Transposase DDE domain
LSKESKDADGRAKSRQQVAEDMRDLLDRFADHAGLRDRPSYQALATVFEQQCEIVNDGVQVRSKTGGACVQNPSDLDATYDGKKGQGYQAQFSETCSAANDVQLIVSALPQTAVESDANALEPMLADLQKRDLLPEEMLADTAYGSDDNVQKAAALGVEVVSPVSGPTTTPEQDAHGEVIAKLTIDDFAVDERTGKVEACPAGRVPLQVVYDAETTTTTIHMSPEDCAACPFRAQCPIEVGKSTCKVSYTDKQKRLEGRRREQETDVFRQRYAKRSGLESTNSGVKRRLGLGQLRVRGRRAVNHAIYLKVAGWNLLRAAASGKLRGRVAQTLAQIGAALIFCLAYTFWRLACRWQWSAQTTRCIRAIPNDPAG